jgi:hypothetical protein
VGLPRQIHHHPLILNLLRKKKAYLKSQIEGVQSNPLEGQIIKHLE